MYLMVRMDGALLSGEWNEPLKAGGSEHPGGLIGQPGDLDGPRQFLHPLPEPKQDSNARAVHEGDAGAVNNELAGKHFVDLPLQVLHQAFDTMVVDVPRQGDGEHAIMGGVGNSHRENPLSFEGG